MNNPEPMLDVARGDIAVSRQVSAALRAIATSTRDESLKRQIGEILAGRGSVRDLAGAEAFNRVLDGVLPAEMRKIAELPEEERDRLAEQGRAELERFRESPNPTLPRSTAPANDTALTAERSSEPVHTPAPATTTPQRGVIPGTRKPDRERIVTPDEPDDDDLYYQDRQQRGWLQ